MTRGKLLHTLEITPEQLKMLDRFRWLKNKSGKDYEAYKCSNKVGAYSINKQNNKQRQKNK